jgi:hypothetical protein
VTHLEITDWIEWVTWSALHLLPRLSHLLLDWVLKFVVPGAVDAVKCLLSHCVTLQGCVIRHHQALDGVTYPTFGQT